MGHRISKGSLVDSSCMPHGQISVREENLTGYSSRGQATGSHGDTQFNATSGELGVPMETHIPDRPSDRRDSRLEGRRPSIYSTMDAVPQLDFYANSIASGRQRRNRPSLEILRKISDDGEYGNNIEDSGTGSLSAVQGNVDVETGIQGKTSQPVRFGWVMGVMVRCMLNIWGVILFLRLSWITAQAGIILTWVIILMSVVVTTITALSVSAISTNGRIKSGE